MFIGKKAQMEIMGLAIIIILLALAMLFVVQFVILRQPSDIKKTFTHKELAANTVNTLLATTTDCRELPISQLLEDCADGGNIPCPTGNSCSQAEEAIEQILAKTLDEWNKEYYMTVKVAKDTIAGPFGNILKEDIPQQCPGEKITSSPCCILPTGAGQMIINLDICG